MKKITKNNKGFSLIELIIVIAIMAVLVAIIAPNLTKYLGSSKKNTDKKNADELAAQIQNCITDFEQDDTNGYIQGASISWSGATATVSSSSNDTAFAKLLNAAITSATKSKETGADASATVTAKDPSDYSQGYEIKVTLGNANVTR